MTMENKEAKKAVCKNCIFAEPLEETLEGVLYFCEFRGCACSPGHMCHAFENKNKEENNNGIREDEQYRG